MLTSCPLDNCAAGGHRIRTENVLFQYNGNYSKWENKDNLKSSFNMVKMELKAWQLWPRDYWWICAWEVISGAMAPSIGLKPFATTYFPFCFLEHCNLAFVAAQLSKPMDISQNIPHCQWQCFLWPTNELVLFTFLQEWTYDADWPVDKFYSLVVVIWLKHRQSESFFFRIFVDAGGEKSCTHPPPTHWHKR